MTGAIVLVVGPSGAGKDTLINLARAQLAHDAHFVFARRVITRPPGDVAEDHEAVTPEVFDIQEAADAFCLSWRAHGHGYGAPRSLIAQVAAGHIVVVNVSRAVVERALALFARVVVVQIAASPATLAARLASRARETPADIAARISRAANALPTDVKPIVIANDGPRELAGQVFVSVLQQIASGHIDGATSSSRHRPGSSPPEPVPVAH